jgi:hypothetical protein
MAIRRVNKSAAIRDLINQNPKAKAREIVSLLAEIGIKVKPHFVYIIRAKMKPVKPRRTHQQAMTTTSNGNGNAVELILKVKGLAKEVGGIGSLKQLVDALAE